MVSEDKGATQARQPFGTFFWQLVTEGVLGARYVIAHLMMPFIIGLLAYFAWSLPSWAFAAGALAALTGFVWSVSVIYRASRAMYRGEAVELTPVRTLVVPILLMVAGVLVPWQVVWGGTGS